MHRFVCSFVGAEAHLGVKAFVEVERQKRDCRGSVVVVAELHYRQPFHPVVLHVVAVCSETLFDFLISLFSLAVSLWVISC